MDQTLLTIGSVISNSPSHLMKQQLLLPSSYTSGNWGLERLSNLPKITQLPLAEREFKLGSVQYQVCALNALSLCIPLTLHHPASLHKKGSSRDPLQAHSLSTFLRLHPVSSLPFPLLYHGPQTISFTITHKLVRNAPQSYWIRISSGWACQSEFNKPLGYPDGGQLCDSLLQIHRYFNNCLKLKNEQIQYFRYLSKNRKQRECTEFRRGQTPILFS